MQRRLISSGSQFEEQIGYSRAVVVGDTVYVSGTTGYDYSTMRLAQGVVAQCEQILKNLNAALAKAGSSLDEVVRVTYMLPNPDDFKACWPVLGKAFAKARPAATMISCELLNKEILIEIEVTAVKGSALA